MASDELQIKINTFVQGRNELEKAIADVRKLIGTVGKGDKEMSAFSKQLDDMSKSLRELDKASTQVKTPDYSAWESQWNKTGKQIKSTKDKMRELMAEIDILANKDDPLKRAFDPTKQKDLDAARAKMLELSGILDDLNQKQDKIRQHMGEMNANDQKYEFIDYDKLTSQAEKAKGSVDELGQKVQSVQNQRTEAEQKVADAAKAANETQKSSYKELDDSITRTSRKLNDLIFDAKNVGSTISKAKDQIAKGEKLSGYDLEQYTEKLNALTKGAEKAASVLEEVQRQVSLEYNFGTGDMSEEVYKHLTRRIIDAKDAVIDLNVKLEQIGPEGEKALGPYLAKLNELKAVQDQIENIDLAKAIAFNDKDALDKYNGLVGQFNELVTAFQEVVNTENMNIDTNEQLKTSWLMVDVVLERVKDSLAQLKQGEGTGAVSQWSEEYNELQRMFEALKARSKEYTNETKRSLGIESKSAKSKQALAHQVRGLSDSLGDVKKNLSKMGDAVSKVTNDLKSKFKSGLKSLMKYVLGFRSLFFLVRKLRSGVKEGIDNLVQYDSANNETNKAISELQSSLLFLKNAWAAAFAPIINAVMPLLTSLIDLLAEAGNAVARFFATLTGQATVLQAVKVDAGDYADSLKKTGSAAGGAAKKVKDLHDRLAPFDDLQVLGVDKDKDRGGSGGGGGSPDSLLLDPNEMFKRIQSESNLADMLKAAWASEDFSGIGRLAGLKIKEAFDSINWDSIRENMSKGIKSVTSFINGFLQTPGLFSSAGTTIAESLNTVTGAIDQFFNEIEFFNNAKSIGEGFTSFFTGIDFGQIASAISGILKSLPETISGFLAGVNWNKIGKSLYNGIKSFIVNFDLAGINRALGKLLGYLVKAIAGLAKGLGEEFAKDVKAYFEENSILDILKDVLSVLTGDALLNWMIDNVSFPFAEGILEAFGASTDEIATVTAKAKETLTHPFTLAVEKIKEVFTGIANWFDEKVVQPIINFFKPIGNAISVLFKNTVSIIYGIWLGVSNWFNEHVIQPIVEFFAPIVETVSKFFSDLWEDIKGVWDTVSTWFYDNVIDPVVGYFKDIWDTVSGYFSDLWDDIKEVWEAASTWFSDNVIDPIVELFDGIAESIKGAFNAVLGVIEDAINGIIGGFNKLIDKLNEWGEAGAEALGLEYTSIPSFKEITIPRLAQGAVIPPNREFLAMLGDQKSGTNIEAPLDTIVDAFREVMGSIQVEASNQVLQVDGQTFARLMTPYMVSELSRRGYNVRVLEA